jgi:hypothetical protein
VVFPGANDLLQQQFRLRRERAGGGQPAQAVADRTQDAQRDTRSALRDRREDRVQPDSEALAGRSLVFRQPPVHPWLRVVEPATGGEGQSLSQPPHRRFVREADRGAFQPAPAVDPHRIGCGHQHIGDPGIVQQRFQRAGAGHLRLQQT